MNEEELTREAQASAAEGRRMRARELGPTPLGEHRPGRDMTCTCGSILRWQDGAIEGGHVKLGGWEPCQMHVHAPEIRDLLSRMAKRATKPSEDRCGHCGCERAAGHKGAHRITLEGRARDLLARIGRHALPTPTQEDARWREHVSSDERPEAGL